ncbi:MAG TPA: hypothetical protein VK335_03510 [Bryobacteraceae bacterium]|nr:hypothetical protein [Bryobacteraceae bacterium]
MASQLVKIQETTAAEICARFELEQKALPLLRGGIGPREFVEALLADKQYATGIDFMAHALPAREAVWWGCLCLQHACGNNLSAADRVACTAAVQWVMRPTEQNRAAAKGPAEAAKAPSPAGALARATSLTGGSLGPSNLPPVAPPPFAWAAYVATAVKFAAIKAEPARIAETRRLFVELGIGLAEGRYT